MAKSDNTGLWLATLGAVGAAVVGLVAANKSSSDSHATQGSPEAMGFAAGREARRGARLGRRGCGCDGGQR